MIAILLAFMGQLLALIIQVIVAIVLAVLDFVLVVIYACLWIIRILLPFLLRAACVAVWIFGMGYTFAGVRDFYALFSISPVQPIAVGLAVVAAQAATPVLTMQEHPKWVWGSMVAASGLGILLSIGLSYAIDNEIWYLVAGIMPCLVAGVFTIYLATKGKILRGRLQNG